jgi:hypothetical protein
VEGKLQMWCDHPEGINPGNIQVYERRDNADTDILFATNVTVRVKSDGWIVAWLTNDQNISDIVFWSDMNSATNPSDTTIGKAIWRITNRVDIDYNKDEVNYYSYKYPAADRLLIGGRMVRQSQETYHFFIPSATTVYMANLTWTAYLNSNYCPGSIKMDNEYVFSKSFGGNSLHEYARYARDVTGMARDTRHTICMYSGSVQAVLKSAVVILYQSG